MRFFLLFVTCIIAQSCYSPKRDCASFKTGTFEFEALSGTEVFKTSIVRNDSIEIDFYKGKTDTSSIRWINDCEYILTKINPRNMAENKAIHIKILTTDKNKYTFEFKEVGKTQTKKATARKISP